MGWAKGESESQCDLGRNNIFFSFLSYNPRQEDSWKLWVEGRSASRLSYGPGTVLHVSGSLPSHRSWMGPDRIRFSPLPHRHPKEGAPLPSMSL